MVLLCPLLCLCPETAMWYDSTLNANVPPRLTEKDQGFLVHGQEHAKGDHSQLLQGARVLEPEHCRRRLTSCGARFRKLWIPSLCTRLGGSAGHTLLRECTGVEDHFRQQAHGVGRPERKTVWIEPALIGAKGEEQ
jgi:hypothetical protein